jgi:non-specific serine/threonine protein kinase
VATGKIVPVSAPASVTSSEPNVARGRSLAISPSGLLRVAAAHAGDEEVSGPAAERIAKAFERGEGFGLLELGTTELETVLPAAFGYFRELARAFLTRLCTIANLEEQRERVEVERDETRLDELVRGAPPVTGSEYLTRAVLERLWSEMETALRAELAAHGGTVQSWLERKNAAWNLVGRVSFHLAENKRDPEAPFAFLATYTARLSAQGKAQHKPLGQALTEYAGAKNKAALLSLLLPVQRAARTSELVRALVDSGEVYQPLAWSPREAYRFLKEAPVLESSGVVVRIPDWWKRRPPRPEVRVTVGEKPVSTIGVDSLLAFKVDLTLDGGKITPEEWEKLLASTQGLALVKGKWVEVDRDKLSAVLGHWKTAEREAGKGGLTFLESMRLLAGVSLEEKDEAASAERRDWSRVVAGAGLREVLGALSSPGAHEVDAGVGLRTELRPYQKAGLAWLWKLNRLGLGGCLADDMGLGKTIQVLALFLLVKKLPRHGPSLLVVPASLVANWKAEAERFAPDLRFLVAHPSERPSAELARLGAGDLAGIDVVLTTYGSLQRLEGLAKTEWELVVLDEAQAIKNPGAKQTRAAKALVSRTRLALTGTPVENRLSDLWSIFDFVCPGLLGSAAEFGRLSKRIAASDSPGRYAPLRELVRPYILRRLKTDKTVISDLPEKTEVRAFCSLTKKQAALYQETVKSLARELETREGIERRGVVLAYLLRLKQICNHPSQWLGDGAYDPGESGKLARLRELVEPIAARQEKVLVFTQFREMTAPLSRFLESVFGRSGLVLHGETRVKDRRSLVESFQDEQGPPFFVLSLKAGGTGLNLTAASHVIHFDRWWNPAVENQATDRAFRIGQKKGVLVHKFVCRGTVEEKVDALIESKRELASSVVEGGGGDVLLTELPNDELLRLVSLDIHSALAEA